MEIKNNPTLEKNIEIVADWIEYECSDRRGEIEWLLTKLFAEQVEWVEGKDNMYPNSHHIRTLNEDITNVYDAVFERLESEVG